MGKALLASIDGRVSDPAETGISILDDGLLRGDGVFEAIKLYRGKPFRLRSHLDRLESSAAALMLPVDRPALEQEIWSIVSEFKTDTMLRIVLTRGGRRILIVEELPLWAPTIDVATVRVTPNEILAGVKSTSYAANMQSTRIARLRGASEAVYVDRKNVVLEAPTSSIFWVSSKGVLRTPALGTGILDSITRRVVLEGIPVEEGRFKLKGLLKAREAFLASTTREIQPIASIDGIPLPESGGGDFCDRATRTLVETVERELGAAYAGRQ